MDNPTEGGRPPFKPTKKHRDEVMNMIATGSTVGAVAVAIGVTPNTLREHFPEEIATAKAKKWNEWLSWLAKSAKNGNVAAQRAILTMVVQDEPAPGEEAKPRLGQLGKKEVAQKQAEGAAIGLYETPSAPGKAPRTVQ